MAFVRILAAITAALGAALGGVLLVFFRDPDIRAEGWVSLGIACVLLACLFWGSRRKRILHRARVAYENGLLDYERCRLAKAARHLGQAARLYSKAQDRTNEALSYMELGNCENDAGHPDAAIEALQKAMDLWERIPESERTSNTWRLLCNCASAMMAKGDLDSAESYARRAVRQCEAHQPDALERAQCQLVLGGILRAKKNFTIALPLIKGARDTFERRKHPLLWQALLELAKLHDDQDQFEAAGSLYKLSCQLIVDQVGSRHVEFGRALESHAGMLARAGKMMDAAMMQARAAGILDVIR
ncbi:MAG: tetratricopeptide repeat protein [Acidobacteria bacterium]|nr:tetratricopeptide repeat protein [Acidobacteriota bacterium]